MRHYVLIALLALAGCRDALIAEAEDAVRAGLTDPYSVHFEDIRRCAKPDAVFGQFNAKNLNGGYTGRTAFLYVHHRVYLGEFPGIAEYEAASRECYSDAVLNETDAFMRNLSR